MSEIEPGTDGHQSAADDSPGSVSGSDPVPPRLLGLFEDFYDEAGNNVGWEPVRWALHFPDGAVLTFTGASASSATLWLSLDGAVEAFGRPRVATVEPQRYSHWKAARAAPSPSPEAAP